LSLIDGQDVSAAITNAAFVSRTTDTNTVGVLALENTANVSSGALITNAQRAVNETFDAVGMTGEGDATRKNYSSNKIVTNGDSHKVAIGKLDAEFHETTGHAHSGAAGDGQPIDAANLDNINLFFAEWQSFTKAAVSGSTATVTTELAGKISGGTSGSLGVITTAPSNKIAIFDSLTGQGFEDLEGQKVFGRITYSAPDFTVGFFTNEVGVETTYNFASPKDMRFFYLEVFNQSTRPTIPNGPEFGSMDLTADIADADQFRRGLVSTGNQTLEGFKTFASGVQTTGRFSLGENVDSTSTGADVIIGTPVSFVYPLNVLTNAGVTSVSGLIQDGFNKIAVVINATGNAIDLNNNSVAVVSPQNRILTGGGTTITWKNNQAFYFIWDNSTQRWHLSGQDAGTFSLTAFGSTPNVNGASYNTGTGVFNLEPASPSFPGGVTTSAQGFSGKKTFAGGALLAQDVSLSASDDSTSGAATALVTNVNPVKRLTNASLDSVSGLVAPSADSKIQIVMNKTGGPIVILNEDASATAANRILTGTGQSINMAYNSSLFFVYNFVDSRWQVVGGSGGGGSELNFIENGDAEAQNDFTTYADAAGIQPVDGTGGAPTLTAASISASSPLSGSNSFLLAKDAAANRQGQGWSIPFTIDLANRARLLKLSFDYLVAAGSFVAGSDTADSDLTMWIYDVTNSRLVSMHNNKLFSNSSTLAGEFQSLFQSSPDSTSYRLIFHLGTTSATALTLQVDNIKVTPSCENVYGSPVLDIVPTTLSFTNFTVSSQEFFKQRVGDTVRLHGKAVLNAAPGGLMEIDLPSDIPVDLDKETAAIALRSSAYAQETGVGVHDGAVEIVSASKLRVFGDDSAGRWDATTPFTWASGDEVYLDVTFAVAGWSSSVIMSSETDGRITAARYTSTAGQSIPDATTTTILYGTVTKDTHGNYNPSTGIYTPHEAGWYRFKAQNAIATAGQFNGTTESVGLSFTKVVGPTEISRNFDYPSAASVEFYIEHNDEFYLNAGEQIRIEMFQDSGGTRSLGTGSVANFLAISKLSGPSHIAATEAIEAIYSNTAGSTVTTSDVALPYAVKAKDTHLSYNTSTGIFTAPAPGTYVFHANAISTSALSASFAWYLYAYKNTSTRVAADLKAGTGAANTTNSVRLSGSVELLAGDTFQINTLVDGGTLTLLTADGYNTFSIYRKN